MPGICTREAGLDHALVKDSVGTYRKDGQDRAPPGLPPTCITQPGSASVLMDQLIPAAQAWAFVLGMVLFALDALLLFPREEWISLGLHVVVLFFVGRGFMACRKLKSA